MRRWLALLVVAGAACSSSKHTEKNQAASDPYADALRSGPPAGYTPSNGPPDGRGSAGPRGFAVEHAAGKTGNRRRGVHHPPDILAPGRIRDGRPALMS